MVRFEGDAKKADNVYKGVKPLSADDIADVVHYATSVPAHVNLNRIEVMPTIQSFGPLPIHRNAD